MSYLSSLFSLFGGLGMFLYGMTVMSDGMQKAASSKMSKFLNIVTENRVMAVFLNPLVLLWAPISERPLLHGWYL